MVQIPCIMIFSIAICFGQMTNSRLLSMESEKYCIYTSKESPTPKMIVDKVDEACKVIEKEGKRGFLQFKRKKSRFIFAGTYIWISDFKGKMLMHPISPNLENQVMINLKDINGKQFFSKMIEMAKTRGNGWVDYFWSKPNSKAQILKLTFVKKSYCDGVPVIIGCSVDDKALKQESYTERISQSR